MDKIAIKRTNRCDTRVLKKGEVLTKEAVETDTLYHREAVNKCGEALVKKLTDQFKEHDHTKLGKYLPAFTEALSTGFKGKEFKGQDWWKIHLTERHHLNDRVPEDVNLIDVLEMICDCVSAGMARSGKVFDLEIPSFILEEAVANTVKMLIKSIEVID